MKIAVISDIHGNALALEAVLADISARSISSIVNLGDHFYGPVAPAATWQLLEGLDCVSLLGNQDRMLLEASKADTDANPTLQFVLDELAGEAIDWLKTLPAEVELNSDVYLCHGAPGIDSMYLLENIESGLPNVYRDKPVQSLLRDVSAGMVLCGHTHIPRTVQLDSGQVVVNPGSVGLQAYEDEEPVRHRMENFSPHARYAVIERSDGAWRVDHINVVYDWCKAAACASDRGRENWARYLTTGRA